MTLEQQIRDWESLTKQMNKIKEERDKNKMHSMLKEFYTDIRTYNKVYNMKFNYTRRPE